MTAMIYAQGDDWVGVYVDGQLVTEGHSIRPLEMVEICIERKITCAEGREVDVDWLHDRGDLPAKLEDVKWA
ncbi:hypothetical protein ACTG4Q_20735 [Bradyrhizobium denitrificans]